MSARAPTLSAVLLAFAFAFALTAGCGTAKAPEPRVAELLGEDEQLLAVDWPSSMRAELEASVQRGVGVVAYRPGEGVRVLPACTAAAAYRVATLAPKEDIVRLESREQIQATLPFSAGGLEGRVGGGGETEEVVDVALVMTKQSVAPALPFSRSELHGDCAGATHVVSGLLRGAFVVAVRSKSDAAVSADVLGLGMDARKASRALVAKSDGDPAACRSARASTPSCDALVKITLRPIAGTNPLTRRGDSWGKATCNDCAAECDRGDMMACVSVGMREMRDGNDARAERLLRAACDAQNGHGCACLGMLYDPGGRDPGTGAYADPAKAVALYARGCDLGSLTGCKLLGFHVHDAERFRIEEEPHARRVAKACFAADSLGCSAAAVWYQAKAHYLAAKGRPGVIAAFDQAIDFERRYCKLATKEELARTPCLLDNWTKVRAELSR